jgi:hypothetical protein
VLLPAGGTVLIVDERGNTKINVHVPCERTIEEVAGTGVGINLS